MIIVTGIIVSIGNLVFFPLLGLDPMYAVAILSVILALVFVIANKLMVNQDKLKHVKAEMKKIQAEIKKAKGKNNDKELSKLWEKSMKINHQQLTMVLKPMVVSMLLIFMVFPWMKFAYGDVVSPINDSSVVFTYSDFETAFDVGETTDGLPVVIDSTSGKSYKIGDKVVILGREWIIDYKEAKNEDDPPSIVFKTMKVKLPVSVPFVGQFVGWLGFYIIVSIPATIILRKLLRVQ